MKVNIAKISILEATLGHLIHGEFGRDEHDDHNSVLGNHIIEYTKCTGKEGRNKLQGIEKFTDYRDSSSFLALLKKIREENIRKEQEMAECIAHQKKEIEELHRALTALDPAHPLLKSREKIGSKGALVFNQPFSQSSITVSDANSASLQRPNPSDISTTIITPSEVGSSDGDKERMSKKFY